MLAPNAWHPLLTMAVPSGEDDTRSLQRVPAPRAPRAAADMSTGLWQAAGTRPRRTDLLTTAAAETASLSHGDSLGLLLSVEGFMFAAISLAVTLGAPDQTRQPRYPRLDPEVLLLGAAAALCLVATGALVAWLSIFAGGSYRGPAEAVEAGALLLAVMGQPAIALLLTLAARRA